jgi:hypothetical protein
MCCQYVKALFFKPEFEEQMTIARKGMSKYRNALHELAK